MLLEVWARYRRPMIVSETGSEGQDRPRLAALRLRRGGGGACERGCELHGITLYPVVNHPGWVDDRRCENGLWDYADADGERALYFPLAEELRRQMPRLLAARAAMLARAGGSLAIPA